MSYIRVSTAGQGASGLGLEAQRQAVSTYVNNAGGQIIAEYREIESGKHSNRPALAKAIGHVRLKKATLVIAKLDRLARNVQFISGLMEDNVDFVCCDMPTASRFTIHVMAAMAEFEAEMISKRTKEAFAVVKAAIERDGYWITRKTGRRITQLGSPNLVRGCGTRAACRIAREARSRHADAYANDVMRLYLEPAVRAGAKNLRELARIMTARAVPTPSGDVQPWQAVQVWKIFRRLNQPMPHEIRRAATAA